MDSFWVPWTPWLLVSQTYRATHVQKRIVKHSENNVQGFAPNWSSCKIEKALHHDLFDTQYMRDTCLPAGAKSKKPKWNAHEITWRTDIHATCCRSWDSTRWTRSHNVNLLFPHIEARSEVGHICRSATDASACSHIGCQHSRSHIGCHQKPGPIMRLRPSHIATPVGSGQWYWNQKQWLKLVFHHDMQNLFT